MVKIGINSSTAHKACQTYFRYGGPVMVELSWPVLDIGLVVRDPDGNLIEILGP